MRPILPRRAVPVRVPASEGWSARTSAVAELLLVTQLRDEAVDRQRWERCDVEGSTRCEVDRQVRNGFVVWRIDDREEIERSEQRVLRHDVAAELFDLV